MSFLEMVTPVRVAYEHVEVRTTAAEPPRHRAS
jgi:hypothetical protein